MSFTAEFAERKVKKEYRAIVAGNVRLDNGVVKGLITRSVHNRKKMAISKVSGKEAVTEYNVLERFGVATYLSLRPVTGRTHQLRVHLSHMGHAILGDDTYARRRASQPFEKKIPRQMLHAYRITFDHPVTGKKMKFTAPLPDDIKDVLSYLRALER